MYYWLTVLYVCVCVCVFSNFPMEPYYTERCFLTGGWERDEEETGLEVYLCKSCPLYRVDLLLYILYMFDVHFRFQPKK